MPCETEIMTGKITVLISTFLFAISIQIAKSSDLDPARFDKLLGTEWYGVYMQGTKAGFAEMSLEKVDRPVAGWRTRESMTIILNVLGKTDTMKVVDTRFYMSPGGELFSSKLKYSSV